MTKKKSNKIDFMPLFNRLANMVEIEDILEDAELPLFALGLAVESSNFQAQAYAKSGKENGFALRLKKKLSKDQVPELEDDLQKFLHTAVTKGQMRKALDRWLDVKRHHGRMPS